MSTKISTSTIDWEGLSRDLQQIDRKWTPLSTGGAIDFEGLNAELGYDDTLEKNRTHFKTGIQVEFDGNGAPWYQAVSKGIEGTADWVADKLYIAAMGPIYGTYLIAQDAAGKNPGVQVARAKERLKKIRKGEEVYDPLDFIQIPIGGGSIPLGDFWESVKGIPGGIKQNIELITGGVALTGAERVDKQELAGFVLQLERGEITKEDFNEYIDWLKERDANIPVAREIGSGIINSMLIMGELVATGGVVAFSTTGLKFLSRAWFKKWGANVLQQGINTWKLMGAGATVKAFGDANLELREAVERGEDPTLWDFTVDLTINAARNNVQAVAEGLSEGILLGFKMGSVNLATWMGKGVQVFTKVPGKAVIEETKHLGVRGLKRLIKGFNPEGIYGLTPSTSISGKALLKTYKAALKETITMRKTLAKQLAKNAGNKLLQGLGIETATEQITDAVSDIMDEDSHSSAIWLYFGDDKEKQEALRNLIVEVAVGFSLGTSMGVGDIWSRKIVQEIEDQFGGEVAKRIEKTIKEKDTTELMKIITEEMAVDKDTKVAKREGYIVGSVMDQGSGKTNVMPEDTEDKELMDIIQLSSPQIIKKSMDIVDDLPRRNILDYTFQQGKQEILTYLAMISLRDSKGDATEGGENKGHLNYNLNSYMMDASPEEVHSVTEVAKRKIVGENIANGLMKAINWLPSKVMSELRSDIGVGIALGFDEQGWAFLAHMHKSGAISKTDDIEFLIDQAKALQASDREIIPNSGLEDERKTMGEIQQKARKILNKSISETLGNIVAGVGYIESSDLEVQDERYKEHEADIQISYDAITGSELVKGEEVDDQNEDLNDDLDDLGSFLDDDIIPQDAPSVKSVVAKVKKMAEVIGIEYRGFQTWPTKSATDAIVLEFFDPISEKKFTTEAVSLTHKKLEDKTITLRGFTPMERVAFRYDGQIIERGNLTHAGLANILFDEGQIEKFWDDYVEGRVEEGFLDKDRNFYNREEARVASGIDGEAISQGVVPGTNLLFESQLPDLSFKLPKYEDVLNDFSGKTIESLAQYLKDKGVINQETLDVVDKLLPVVGKRGASIVKMDAGNPGGTSKTTLAIQLNPQAVLWSHTAVWDTLVHEMLHSYLHGFMNSDSQASKIFNGKINGVLNTVKAILNSSTEVIEGQLVLKNSKWKGSASELMAWKKQHIALIRKSFTSPEEFITAVISDTQSIKWITDRVEMGGAKTKVTGWRRIWSAITEALNKQLGIERSATKELLNILESQNKVISAANIDRDREFSPRAAKEHRRLSKNVTSGYDEFEYNNDEDNYDHLDPGQIWDDILNDDENAAEAESIENFTRFTSVLFDVPEGELRSNMRIQSEYYPGDAGFSAYLESIDKLDAENKNIVTRKLQHLYLHYKNSSATFEKFKRSFLKRQWLNVVYKSPKEGYIFMGVTEFDRNTGDKAYHFEMRKVKGTYRDGNGKKRNTFRRDIALETYIPALEKLLELEPDTLKIAYMEGFETWKDGKVTNRSSLDGLSPQVFGQSAQDNVPVTGFLSDALWESSNAGASKDGLLYIGSFAGKNTLPVLSFAAKDQNKIKAALLKHEALYLKTAKEEYKDEYGDAITEGRRMTAISRLLLENLWFLNQDTVTKDFNKIMKRSPKWYAADTGAVINLEEIEEEFGNAPLNGMTFENGDVTINAAVISSTDETVISYDLPNGKHLEIPLNVMMLNELGTETSDGAIFYVIGHLDKIYKIGHGVLKDGALKSVYASKGGQEPLFLKYAMHGVTGDSILGQWMLQHNAAALISDTAMKEGPEDKIIGAAELTSVAAFKDRDPMLKLKLSQFTRISESEYKDKLGGSMKQLTGGSGFDNVYNSIIGDVNKSGISLNKIMKDFTSAQSQETVKWFKENSTPEALYNLLKDIVYNPRSPQERSVSDIWLDKIEPVGEQTVESILDKFAGTFDHAHTAEVLRNRLQHRLSQLMGGKTTGIRVVLDPNMGYGNFPRDVDPIEKIWNLGEIIIGSELDAKLAAKAFPEPGLRPLVKILTELQREESRAHSFLKGIDQSARLEEIQNDRTIAMKQIRELDSTRLNDILKGDKKISPYRFVNWADLKEWRDSVVYGTPEMDATGTLVRKKDGILDERTGRLRKGWTIITEDAAAPFGIKPGDWVLVVVTPLDSPLGVAAVRVAAIAHSKESKSGGRKVSDNNKGVFNSEWLQTLVGKDFDIDTISIIPFDPRIWTKANWDQLMKITSKTPDAYARAVARETDKLFKRHNTSAKDKDGNTIPINENTVFMFDEIRELYSILMNGVPKKKLRRRFSILGDSFIELDSNYLHSPAPIINERIMHTLLSAMNFRSKGVSIPLIMDDGPIRTEFKRGEEVVPLELDFVVRNANWTGVHVHQLNMTHAEVDFPNNTVRLAYVSDPKTKAYRIVMGGHFWGIGGQADAKRILRIDQTPDLKLANLNSMFSAIKDFQRLLFGDALGLARQKSTDTFEKLDYYETIQQLRRAQIKLAMLDRNDKAGLMTLVSEMIEAKQRALARKFDPQHRGYIAGMKVILQQQMFLNNFIQELEIDNVYDYPLFNIIKNINAEEMLADMPGNTYKDHLINQVLASIETLPYYPGLADAYADIQKHSIDPNNALFKVGERTAYKPANAVLRALKFSDKRPVQAVRDLLNNPSRLDEFRQRLNPDEKQDLADALIDFKQLEAKIGKAFEPFNRDGKLINVDHDAIAFAQLDKELDFKAGRKTLPRKDKKEYWSKQLRSVKAEANTILHGFDEVGSFKEGLSDQQEMIRMAHAVTYPILWKSVLDNQYIFASSAVRSIKLSYKHEDIEIINTGSGTLNILYKGKSFTHTEVNDQESEGATELYKLFTERGGVWEGVANNSEGTFNRVTIGEMVGLARNITMEKRQEILESYIGKQLYANARGFSRDDQLGFWLGLLPQTSDQGMVEKKGTNFIVIQSLFDGAKPFKFQSNHLVLNLLSQFEPEMLNLWMQLYNRVNGSRTTQDLQNTRDALLAGRDANVDMMYQDAPVESPGNTLRHFFSDYAKDHKALTKNQSYRDFKKFMNTGTWKEGLARLRKLTKTTSMMKALSENGVFYEDMVRDINTLDDKKFLAKYKDTNPEAILDALDKYSAIGEEFVKQRVGESDEDALMRGNLHTMFYTMNSVQHREGKRNKKLTLMRKLASNVVGYDLLAELSEKQTRATDHPDEVAGFLWQEEGGPRTFSVEEAMNIKKTHATRTFMPVGESTLARLKQQRINNTLATHQVDLNFSIEKYNDVVRLLSESSFRDNWRTQFAHKRRFFGLIKGKQDKIETTRTAFITELIDQIPEGSDRQLEIRREEVWKLAEDLRKTSDIWVEQSEGQDVVYHIEIMGKHFQYDSIASLITKHMSKASAQQKLTLVGAVDTRIMYDLQVPRIINQALTYLKYTRADLSQLDDMDAALKVDAMISKYKDMLDAVVEKRGNYMPHQFPIARYKDLWMKGYMDHAIAKIEDDIIRAKKDGNNPTLALMDIDKDTVKIKKMAYDHALKSWDAISYGWSMGAIITNFLPRKMPDVEGYTRTDPTVHFNYNTKLIEGLRSDALMADWYIYQSNARSAGERTHIMELTRRWYANQIGDKDLQSTVIKWDKVKPGMNVTFTQATYILDPNEDVGYLGTSKVSGVVKKITNGAVQLNTDIEHVVWQAKTDLHRYNNIIESMLFGNLDMNKKVSQRQWITMQNYVNKGVITQAQLEEMSLKDMTNVDAANLIAIGLKKIIKNPEMVGVYKRTEVWGQDFGGKAIPNTIERYAGVGGVERLRAKENELHNLQLLGSDYTGAFTTPFYQLVKRTRQITSGTLTTIKKVAALLIMGTASAIPARVVNQLGAVLNNIIDSPVYNYFGGTKLFIKAGIGGGTSRWHEGRRIWDRISHGNIELMEDSDIPLYKTITGLGLTDSNNILAIALEAANIKPEDMLINDATTSAITWLAKLFKDAVKYDSTYKLLERKEREHAQATDPVTEGNIRIEIEEIKLKWKAKMHGLLADDSSKNILSNEEEKALWKKVNKLAKGDPKINLAEEQGFTAAMAGKLMAKVAWKWFFTSNLGIGFQAKAERLRIPGFFIGYTTSLKMGFNEQEAIQMGINSVELRHAFYGSAYNQFGANTEIGRVGFQYAQYQYNAISKMVRIIRESIPQMIRLKHNKPKDISKLKHLMNRLKLVQDTVDNKGKVLMRPGTKISLKEINLIRPIMMKTVATAAMMQLGQRVFYGITNFQDPVGQVVYGAIDFIIDVASNGLDLDDDDDKDKVAWMIQDLALPLGMGWKLALQSALSAPVKGIDDTFLRGRVDNLPDFLWRFSNQVDEILYELGASDMRPRPDNKVLFDAPWIIDDFTTGIKLAGWAAADNRSRRFPKRGLYYGLDENWIPYFNVETRIKKSFAGGRYVETRGQGLSGFGRGNSKSRFIYLVDPFSYIPFIDRLFEGKTIYNVLR